MKRMIAVLLLVVCLLPVEGMAAAPQHKAVVPAEIRDDAIYYINGDLELDKMEYKYHVQTVYRPITYVTHMTDGTVIDTRVVAEPMLTVTYTFYYGINKAEQYVMAGGNPVPALDPTAAAHFAVTAVHMADTHCNAVQLPGFAGYTYTFSGGYFSMDYYNVIHLDEHNNIIDKEFKEDQLIAYKCTFTYP